VVAVADTVTVILVIEDQGGEGDMCVMCVLCVVMCVRMSIDMVYGVCADMVALLVSLGGVISIRLYFGCREHCGLE
jgi:hypothetical protein